MHPASTELPRRTFIRLGLAGALGLPALLQACGGSSAAPASSGGASVAPASSAAATPSGAAPASSAASPSVAASRAPASPAAGASAAGAPVKLPSYQPVTGIKPDLPGNSDGIDDGFLAYPRQPFKSVQSTPGKGGDITIMTWNLQATVPPLDQNPQWQEINRQVGANVKMMIVPLPDYQTKLATTIAGGDLPDVIYIPPGTNIPQFPDLLKAQMADLTPYLSGDAVKAYPNLASNPARAWKATVFNNAIYAVPIPYSAYLWVLWVHQELLDQIGSGQPKNADDFKRILQQLTKPQQNLWGIMNEASTGYGVTSGLYPQIFGAPNNWGLDKSGKLTRNLEVDQFKAAVGYARDLLAAGVYEPNAATANNTIGKADFAARKIAMRYDGWLGGGTLSYWDEAPKLTPPSTIRNIHPFAAGGGKPQYYLSTGNFGFTIVKKASADRLQEVLRILDYFAAPFGSQEYLLLRYGVKDVDFTLDASGNPVITTKGKTDSNSLWSQAIAGYTSALYDPNSTEFPKVMQDEEKIMLPIGVADPTIGLYSATNGAKGALLTKNFTDGVTDIVAGRRPLTDYDQLVKDWKSGGGDQMRNEFQDALQAAGGAG